MVAIDYRVMQNSSSAMALRGQVMPPELKTLEDALNKSGFNDNQDLEQLAFVLYRATNSGGRPADGGHCAGPVSGG